MRDPLDYREPPRGIKRVCPGCRKPALVEGWIRSLRDGSSRIVLTCERCGMNTWGEQEIRDIMGVK